MFDNKNLLANYEDLIAGRIPYFVYNWYDSADNFVNQHPSLHIFSGSFNPLHDMHVLVHDSMFSSMKSGDTAVYEMCIRSRNKACLTFEELETRLNQFPFDMVIVTNSTFFCAKAGALFEHELSFHIGFDTAFRLISDDSVYGVQGIRACFYVYPRDGVGIDTLVNAPKNFYEGKHKGAYVNGVSSTNIRESAN